MPDLSDFVSLVQPLTATTEDGRGSQASLTLNLVGDHPVFQVRIVLQGPEGRLYPAMVSDFENGLSGEIELSFFIPPGAPAGAYSIDSVYIVAFEERNGASGNYNYTYQSADLTALPLDVSIQISPIDSAPSTPGSFTIPFGDFEGVTLNFNDPLLPLQSSILGFAFDAFTDEQYSVPHINLIPVWDEYQGNAIRIGTVELVNYNHPEFLQTYLREGIDPNAPDTEIVNLPPHVSHGTRTAGLITAAANNGHGIVGVAYGATITSFDQNGESGDRFDIVTSSTGLNTANLSTFFFDQSDFLDRRASAAATGRDELGTIMINSAGNDGELDFSSEINDENNYFEIIPISLLEANTTFNDEGELVLEIWGAMTSFGPSILTTAPLISPGDPTRAISVDQYHNLGDITQGEVNFDYHTLPAELVFDYYVSIDSVFHTPEARQELLTGDYQTLGGTSGAAPIVSAITALVLEAAETNNVFGLSALGGLGWRDVQEIYAISSRHIGTAIGEDTLRPYERAPWLVNGADFVNGGGLHYSIDYGFGLVDAHAAVRLAESWSFQHHSGNLLEITETANPNADFSGTTSIEFSIHFDTSIDLDAVKIDLDMDHDFWSEVKITLISPSGTEVVIFNTPGLMRPYDFGLGTKVFNPVEAQAALNGNLVTDMIARTFWGEDGAGEWRVRVEDVVDNDYSGTINSLSLTLLGDTPTEDDIYYFTDDWRLMNDFNGGLPVLDDANGVNSINAAALSEAVSIRLSPGSISKIGRENAFSLAEESVFSLAIGTDQNDTLIGAAGNDTLYGMQGDDIIYAGATDTGNDRFFGGDGADTIGGSAGDDMIAGGEGGDVIFGGSGNDTLIAGHSDGSTSSGNNVTNIIWAGSGDDLVEGDNGNDTLGGGTGNDTLHGGGGDDTLYGGAGEALNSGVNDVFFAGSGDDLVFAGAGNDVLNGGPGADNLFSGPGNDTVAGGRGDDTLWGGSGNDSFIGDSGRDTFVFASGHGDDRVEDFNIDEDVLRLTGTATDFVTVEDVINAATVESNGILIDLGGGNTLFLVGLSLTDLGNVNLVL